MQLYQQLGITEERADELDKKVFGLKERLIEIKEIDVSEMLTEIISFCENEKEVAHLCYHMGRFLQEHCG